MFVYQREHMSVKSTHTCCCIPLEIQQEPAKNSAEQEMIHVRANANLRSYPPTREVSKK